MGHELLIDALASGDENLALGDPAQHIQKPFKGIADRTIFVAITAVSRDDNVFPAGKRLPCREGFQGPPTDDDGLSQLLRSEERRVGKECRSRWSPYH